MNTKDNLMILGKDRRSLEQEGFEDDEVEHLEEYVLGGENQVVINHLESAVRNLEHLSDCLFKVKYASADEKQKLQTEFNYGYLFNRSYQILEQVQHALNQIKSKD